MIWFAAELKRMSHDSPQCASVTTTMQQLGKKQGEPATPPPAAPAAPAPATATAAPPLPAPALTPAAPAPAAPAPAPAPAQQQQQLPPPRVAGEQLLGDEQSGFAADGGEEQPQPQALGVDPFADREFKLISDVQMVRSQLLV